MGRISTATKGSPYRPKSVCSVMLVSLDTSDRSGEEGGSDKGLEAAEEERIDSEVSSIVVSSMGMSVVMVGEEGKGEGRRRRGER